MSDQGSHDAIPISPSSAGAPARRAVSITGGDGPERTRLVLFSYDDNRLPTLTWLGVDVPGLADQDAERLGSPFERPRTAWDAWLVEPAASICPQHADGHLGRPAILGFRPASGQTDPAAWSPLFDNARVTTAEDHLLIHAEDEASRLSLEYAVEALVGGGLRVRAGITNTGTDPYVLERLDVVMPLPPGASEMVDFTGRWGREKQPQRSPIRDGIWEREHRRGARALDATSMVIAGTPGFDFQNGTATSVHLAWSGNHRYAVERLSSGLGLIRAGELLMPGEVVLGAGETYRSPWVHVSSSDNGLDGLAGVGHRYLRSLHQDPEPPPVTFNAWEAVYLDHDQAELLALADLAAEVGAERFVLDDGWFLRRDSLDRGVGDWTPDPDAWPLGLRPLAEHVRGLDMQFGLWWEPETVNVDSDLFRSHPEWVLGIGDRLPALERSTYVLNLDLPAVRGYLLETFGKLVADCPIDFIKWDYNRDLIDAGASGRGEPAARAQVLGLYSLMEDLRTRYPHIAWESCASGGGRIDANMLGRVHSVWPSDSTDPVARQQIQRWTAQLTPIEYLGSHITASPSHQTQRATSLEMRAATALMGQFGIMWDLAGSDVETRATLQAWTSLYKQHRRLLRTGEIHRVDLAPDILVTGVVAPDRSEALFSYAQQDEITHVPPRLRIPGLEPECEYLVSRVLPAGTRSSVLWAVDGIVASGASLARFGLPTPSRSPQSAVLVHLRQIPATGPA